ncbi:MAG TPA: TonB-dependent receptor plug domain-containing protein, partial [Steroidobacteraceae bacterium]|nr:TonB-dependent receptor plug domain-containing protein [Steroidobacteraceae bacterium]
MQASSSGTLRLSCACLAVLWLAVLQANPVRAADGNALSSNELPEVVVVGTTPMGSSALPAEQVPGNVQTLSGKQLQSGHALSVADALNEGLGSVNVNDTQGNPFQLDVNFRGFTASPVLGTPQGLSVFVDGARANEVFGDTVLWDLIPESALANVLLIPGSNPVYGLSSTGGTLAINTKSGFQFPGTSVEASAGAFDRRNLIAQIGGHGQVFDYFSTVNLFQDAGWGEHNGSQLFQWFSKVGYTDEATDVDLSYTRADAELAGNQTLPLSWLDTPRESYTWPDTAHDSINFINLQLRHELADGWALSGNLHERQVHSAAFNSNVNNDFNPAVAIEPANEPTDNVIGSSYQARTGGSAELSWVTLVAGRRNSFAAGVNRDLGTIDFAQHDQP